MYIYIFFCRKYTLQNPPAPDVWQLNKQENVGTWKLTRLPSGPHFCWNECWAEGWLPCFQGSRGPGPALCSTTQSDLHWALRGAAGKGLTSLVSNQELWKLSQNVVFVAQELREKWGKSLCSSHAGGHYRCHRSHMDLCSCHWPQSCSLNWPRTIPIHLNKWDSSNTPAHRLLYFTWRNACSYLLPFFQP